MFPELLKMACICVKDTTKKFAYINLQHSQVVEPLKLANYPLQTSCLNVVHEKYENALRGFNHLISSNQQV